MKINLNSTSTPMNNIYCNNVFSTERNEIKSDQGCERETPSGRPVCNSRLPHKRNRHRVIPLFDGTLGELANQQWENKYMRQSVLFLPPSLHSDH